MDDNEILDLYFARSEQAIVQTDQKYGFYCYSIAKRILSDPLDAEESVNDTYYSAWKLIPPRRPQRFSTFLGKITRNLAIDRWRKNTAEKRGKGETQLLLDELAATDKRLAAARQTIAELSAENRALRFALRQIGRGCCTEREGAPPHESDEIL